MRVPKFQFKILQNVQYTKCSSSPDKIRFIPKKGQSHSPNSTPNSTDQESHSPNSTDQEINPRDPKTDAKLYPRSIRALVPKL